MSILYAYDQTDLDSVDLSFWYASLASDEFNDDAFTDGYEDNYHLVTTTNDALSLYGSGFGRDINLDMVLGTIQDLNQWAWDPDTLSWQLRWHWEGWNVASADFFAAGQTPSTDDDFDLIRAVMSGPDTLYLSDADDTMRGFAQADVIYGYDGNDVLSGDNGRDTLYGGTGADRLNGGKGKDALFGDAGNDILRGVGSDDTLRGGGGRDRLLGGSGDDALYGNTGVDKLNGGKGADRLNGHKGKDNLIGGGGNDLLRGGTHDDTLRGGTGRDTLIGGSGEDVFQFRTGDQRDVIKDFDAVGARHDLLDLSRLASIVSWSDLRDNHMTQDGDDVVIDALSGDRIVLQNVRISDIDEGDVLF